MAFEEVYFDGSEYVPLKRAALVLGKTEDHLKNLAEEGKIESKEVGDALFISVDSLNNFSRENGGKSDLVGVLPSKSAVALLLLVFGTFVYYNFFGAYQGSYVNINRITSYVGTFVNNTANSSSNLAVNLGGLSNDGEASVFSPTASFNPVIILKSISRTPEKVTSLWSNSYIDLNHRTVDFYKNIHKTASSQLSDFSVRFVGSPVTLAYMWRDSYIDLHREVTGLYLGGLDSIDGFYKKQLAGPIEDAKQGLLVVSSVRVSENQTANVLSSVGNFFSNTSLSVKVATKKTGLFFSDLLSGAKENWTNFIRDLLRFEKSSNTEITLGDGADGDYIRNLIREELESILGDVSVEAVDGSKPFSINDVNEGLAVFPAPIDAASRAELINKIQNSFSDNVTVELDNSGRAGIVRTNISGSTEEYIFIITPVNSN